jgi:hypothetical protein
VKGEEVRVECYSSGSMTDIVELGGSAAGGDTLGHNDSDSDAVVGEHEWNGRSWGLDVVVGEHELSRSS